MITDKRQIFLDHFLGLYGVDRVDITKSDSDKVYGIANYIEEEETQEFCWHINEKNLPSDDLIQLIKVIGDNQFNRTDRIIVTADELYEKLGWTDRTKFDKVYDELFDIEVKMIDEGEETHSYFMHD